MLEQARDLHGGRCDGLATLSATKTTGSTRGMAAVGAANVKVLSSESGALLATGTMRPLARPLLFSCTRRTVQRFILLCNPSCTRCSFSHELQLFTNHIYCAFSQC